MPIDSLFLCLNPSRLLLTIMLYYAYIVVSERLDFRVP